MKLELGKRYVTRNGIVTPSLEKSKNGTGYTFAAWIAEPEHPGAELLPPGHPEGPTYAAWTGSGRFLADSVDHRLDIVEPVQTSHA